jgi:hypothetical protein
MDGFDSIPRFEASSRNRRGGLMATIHRAIRRSGMMPAALGE